MARKPAAVKINRAAFDPPGDEDVAHITPDLRPLAVPVSALAYLPGNYRQGDAGMVGLSIGEFTQRKPVVVNARTGHVEAGNTTLRATVAAGHEWIAAVLVEDTPTVEKAFAVADNRASALGWDDPSLLFGMLDDIRQADAALLPAVGWDLDDIHALLQEIEGGAASGGLAPGVNPDDIPETAPDVSQPGDIWLLGPHRLMCGDSTNPDHLAALLDGRRVDALITDPPYGVDYGDTVSFRRALGKTQRAPEDSHVTNDGLEDAMALWAAVFPHVAAVMNHRSAFYCWSPPGDQQTDLAMALRAAGFACHGTVIWDKTRISFSRSDHKYQHEPCLYGWLDKGVHDWHGPNNETSVWEYPKPASSELHPTQKPVDLIERCVRNISEAGDVILDPFVGSGTTIIAAEKLGGRLAFGMELSARYCDIVCRRFQQVTGILPQRAATGEPVDFN